MTGIQGLYSVITRRLALTCDRILFHLKEHKDFMIRSVPCRMHGAWKRSAAAMAHTVMARLVRIGANLTAPGVSVMAGRQSRPSALRRWGSMAGTDARP